MRLCIYVYMVLAVCGNQQACRTDSFSIDGHSLNMHEMVHVHFLDRIATYPTALYYVRQMAEVDPEYVQHRSTHRLADTVSALGFVWSSRADRPSSARSTT